MDAFQWGSCTSGSTSVLDFLSRLFRCSSSPGSMLLSDPRLMITTSLIYLLLISSLYHRYSTHPPKFAQSRAFVLLAVCHNLFLCLSSLAMNLGASRAAYLTTLSSGLSSTVCTSVGFEMPSAVQRWLYVFYLSKFYELLDTALLVLRGRPLTLLHVWHHVSVMYEVWGWLESGVVVGVYGMWFNTLVHVIMYAYYAAALLKVPFPLKKAITTTQIVQFVTGFASLGPYLYLHLTSGGCRGGPGLAVSALWNASYLLLFLRFFKKTYSGNAAGKTKVIEDDIVQQQRTKAE